MTSERLGPCSGAAQATALLCEDHPCWIDGEITHHARRVALAQTDHGPED